MKPRDILYIVLIVILIVFSGRFSAIDRAYSSVRITRLEKDETKSGKLALKYANEYDKTIATVLFGNDFVNILASSLASLLSKDLLEPVIGSIGSFVRSRILLIVLLIFGEITPKALAKTNSFGFSKFFSYFVKVLRIIFFPFVFFVTKRDQGIVFLLTRRQPKDDLTASDDELDNRVDAIQKEGIFDSDKSELLHNSIEFKDTACYEVRTPRVKIIGIDLERDRSKFLVNPDRFRYSRVIVFAHDLDHIVGYIPRKKLLQALIQNDKDYKKLIQPISSVPRTRVISQAMELRKEKKEHILVVRDEYGGTEGIITREDILEEVVGEIWDESDEVETRIRPLKEKDLYLVRGNINIDDFLDFFGLDPDELKDDYSTLSGFLNNELERFAKVGDVISYKNLIISVKKTTQYTVDLCLVKAYPKEEDEEE